MIAPHHGPFGGDSFGVLAERFARFFGTPKFIIAQTVIVAVWIGLNAYGAAVQWDVYPFILLNLVFSTQAAYAAPLILLAQTRQADRDKARAELSAKTAADAEQHREALAQQNTAMLDQNTKLTEAVHALAAEIHQAVTK